MEKRVPVTTYVGADRTVIGEAIIHEDGTCTMTLTSDALTALRVTDRDGDFSMNWFQRWTEEEKATFRRNTAERNRLFKTYDPDDRFNLDNACFCGSPDLSCPTHIQKRGGKITLAVQDELLEPVRPNLEDVLKAEMYKEDPREQG